MFEGEDRIDQSGVVDEEGNAGGGRRGFDGLKFFGIALCQFEIGPTQIVIEIHTS